MKKKKEGYWKTRAHNLRSSFTARLAKGWLKFLVMDFIFLMLFIFLLTAMLVHSVIYMQGFESITAKAMPILSKTSISGPSDSDVQKVSDIKEEFSDALKRLLIIIVGYLIFFALLISCWSYMTLSTLLKVKKTFSSFLKFICTGILWSVLSIAVISIIVWLIPGIITSTITGILLILLSIYFTTILFYNTARKGVMQAVKTSFLLGIKKIHLLGPPFMLCIIIFAAFNLIVYLIRPNPTLIPSLIIILFFTFFLAWSRFYLCIELKQVSEVSKHA